MASGQNPQHAENADFDEFCADELSDVSSNDSDADDPSDTDDVTYDSSDSDVKFTARKSWKNVICSSDSESEMDDWSEADRKPLLEDFEGAPGLKVLPNSAESIPEIVKLFISDELLENMCAESNKYYRQNVSRNKVEKKTLRYADVTVAELKKFLGIIILFGHVKKSTLKEYWTTDPLLETPVFSKLISRARFLQIWKAWHFCSNEEITERSERLFKVKPVFDSVVQKMIDVYKPKREIILDEAVIPWRGRLSFRACNPGKLVRCGLLVRMVCESASGYICNMEIRSGQARRSGDAARNVLKPFLGVWHHLYQDNYCDGVSMAKVLLKEKIRTCGTVVESRRTPGSLRNAALKRGETRFLRKGDVMVQAWKDRKNVLMISTIHDSRVVPTKEVNKKTGEVVRKPIAIIEYNRYMSGVDRADRYLSNYNILRKSVKWTKKVVLFLLNCALFNSYHVYRTITLNKRLRYKQFLLMTARSWVSAGENESESENSSESGQPVSQARRSIAKKDAPTRLSGNMKEHVLVKIISHGKSKYPTRRCRVCASNKIRSVTRYMCKSCNVCLHKEKCFTQYHTRKNYRTCKKYIPHK